MYKLHKGEEICYFSQEALLYSKFHLIFHNMVSVFNRFLVFIRATKVNMEIME